MATIIYDGKETEIKLTTGALYRFERAGYSLGDFGDETRMIQAHVELIRAMIDPKASPEEVADKLPKLEDTTAAITAAMAESGLGEDKKGGPEGNA